MLVIAHLGRCYTLPHAEEALPQLADDDGLYFDSSAVMNPDVYRFALKTLGPRRHPLRHRQPGLLHARPAGNSAAGPTSIARVIPFYLQPRARAARDRGQLHARTCMRTCRPSVGPCEELGLDRRDVEDIFAGNARRLIADNLNLQGEDDDAVS